MLGQEPAGPLPDEGALSLSARPAARTRAFVLAAALLTSGCAAGADVAGLATQDEVFRLRSELNALQRSVQEARAQTEALNNRVSSQASTQATARPAPPPPPPPQRSEPPPPRPAEVSNPRLDSLTATLTALTKRVDDLSSRLDTLGRQFRASVVRPGLGVAQGPPPAVAPPAAPSPAAPATAAPATAAPATAAPATAAPATAAPAAPAPSTAAPARPAPATAAPAPPSPAPAPPPARPIASALPPQDLYQASYIDFSKGNYALAIDGFREFLRRYPDHAQASNAQYWIGEGYAALAQQHANAGQTERATEAYQRAVQEFRKVVANYPRGDRAPTALYKEALTLVELKQPALAQARLQYLVDNFPQAEEIPLARERLAALKK
jgi:tol-pal system protein YbgF